MHAHDFEAVRMVLVIPTLEDREIADTVDARVLPEIYQQHMATVTLDRVRNFAACIDPHRLGIEVGRLRRLRPAGDRQ